MISQIFQVVRSPKRITRVTLVPLALLASACCLQATEPTRADNAAEEGWESIFDGRSLEGWLSVPTANLLDWSVRDGVLVGKGSKNRQVYLVYQDKNLADFELKLEYRMVTKGNSGVQIRARVDQTGKRPLEGYHADFGHVGVGAQVLGAWDFHFSKRKEYSCQRGVNLVIDAEGNTHRTQIKGALTPDDLHEHGWNCLHIVVSGNHLWFSINDRKASEFTDNMPERFKRGMIGLQLHEAGTQVEFRAIRLRRL
jgi:hypothetical protein